MSVPLIILGAGSTGLVVGFVLAGLLGIKLASAVANLVRAAAQEPAYDELDGDPVGEVV